MAGAGFKDFAVGEVLTASDVDTYLMQQSVMRFADSGARGSALGTATGTAVPLAEGMVTYLDDTNTFEIYNGSVWVPPVAGIGSNVVSAVKTDTFSTSSVVTWQDVTGLSVTITPRLSTSKVLVYGAVSISQTVTFSTSSGQVMIRGLRGATVLDVGDAAGNRTRAYTASAGDDNATVSAVPFMVLDSPATTSATTYKIQLFSSLSGGGTAHVNRTEANTDTATQARTVSYLVAVEVAG